MSYRAELEAVTSKLRVTEAEADRLRVRVAELEEDDPEAKDEALARLEARVAELAETAEQIERLKATNAGLRERIKQLEIELDQANALAKPAFSLPASAPMDPRLRLAIVGVTAVMMAICLAILLMSR